DRTNITVGYPQTNRKIDTGKTLTRWPVFVDHFNCTAIFKSADYFQQLHRLNILNLKAADDG
ncbi:hypothetical protein CUC38_12510, partial [Shigella flexneri]